MPRNRNAAHLRVFRFLQLVWTEILTGELEIDSTDKTIKIVYTSTTNDHLIPDCTPLPDHPGEKRVEIALSRLSKIEQDEGDRKIIYLWIDANPFSLSFLSQDRATEACQVLQLIEENMEIEQNEEQQELTSIEYIKSLFESNPGMLSTLFINNNIEVVDVLFKLLALAPQAEMSSQDKQSYFHIFKTAIRVGDKKIVEALISDEHYQLLLTALSWNPFNKYAFDYLAQYKRVANFNNILGITDHTILTLYKENARIKFLRDVAACMFIEIENQRTFLNMLNTNNQAILTSIAKSSEIIEEIIYVSLRDPKGFICIFTELWEIFKSSNFDYESRGIKEQFVATMTSKQLHVCAMRAVHTILKDSDLKATVDNRFHEKWIEALNPFLSYNWQYSQSWICSTKDSSSLLHILYKLASQSKDEGLIQTILNFARWFIEPSQNRIRIQSKLKAYVYTELLEKLWEIMKSDSFLMQIYIDFILKIYKIQIVRTRRMLIENKVLEELQKNIAKKSILICIIKLLDCFLETDKPEIFIYLKNHSLLMDLKVEQNRHEGSHNVVNSCFKSMRKKLQSTNILEAISYFQLIGFPFNHLLLPL